MINIFIILLFFFNVSCSTVKMTSIVNSQKNEIAKKQKNDKFSEAVFFKKKDIIKKMILEGYDINQIDSSGQSIFHTIAFFNIEEIYRYILEIKPDIKIFPKKTEYGSPLMLAAERENIYLVKEFIKRGANPHVIGTFDRNLIHIALSLNNEDLLDIAIKNKVSPLINGFMGKKINEYEVSERIRTKIRKYIKQYKEKIQKN